MKYPDLTKQGLRLALGAMILLAGCKSGPPAAPPTEVLSDAQERYQEMRRDTATAATLIRRPRQPAWLDQAVQADYQNIPATECPACGARESPHTLHLQTRPEVTDGVLAVTGSRNPARAPGSHQCTQANWAYVLDAHTVVISDTMQQRSFELLAAPGVFKGKIAAAGAWRGHLNAQNGRFEPDDPDTTLIHRVMWKQAMAEPACSYAQRGGQDATMSWLPASSTLLVQAPPDVMRMEAAAAVERVNRAASRRVSLELVLYEVDVTNDSASAVSISMPWLIWPAARQQ